MMQKKEESMATVAKSQRRSRRRHTLPPLENGDHLDQKTFHSRYEAMPEDVRAELIGGIVFMASPQRRPHGKVHPMVLHWLSEYEDATPGTEGQANNTQILGPESEPQPDACLFIAPEYGGQVQENEHGYLTGAPEWVAEVSSSTESIDLHRKKLDYEKGGVREYVVVALDKKEVFWFVRRRSKFTALAADADGIFRSQVFPGLWLDGAALLRGDRKRLLAVLREGLATQEHGAFVSTIGRK
jgi:Uma2 family endonuclease